MKAEPQMSSLNHVKKNCRYSLSHLPTDIDGVFISNITKMSSPLAANFNMVERMSGSVPTLSKRRYVVFEVIYIAHLVIPKFLDV